MIFITNGTRKVNVDFIKEININKYEADHIFSIKIIDNADNRFSLDVDILGMLEAEYAGTSLEDYDLQPFAREIRDKTIEDFEQSNCLETALEACENDKLKGTIKEINIEDLVYNNLLELADNFTVPIIFE